MPNYLKDVIGDGMQEITVKKVFDPKSQFNKYSKKEEQTMGAYVIWNDSEYMNYFKEKDFEIAKEGATLACVKKPFKGSFFIEFYAKGPQGQDDCVVREAKEREQLEKIVNEPKYVPPFLEEPEFKGFSQGKRELGIIAQVMLKELGLKDEDRRDQQNTIDTAIELAQYFVKKIEKVEL